MQNWIYLLIRDTPEVNQKENQGMLNTKSKIMVTSMKVREGEVL